MDIVEFREYCLSLPEVEETLPFDDTTLVFKVGGKMFAVIDMDEPDHFVVKCDPERAVELRERYDFVTEAWHFNKKHWNSIRLDGADDDFMRREIRHSYMLVVMHNVTPKALRERILLLNRQ
ncbi:MAG: MmcQ/YjbR family DNA-binding protein [Alistipes sp.]